MQSFISRHARCRVRYHDLPGSGVPLLFIHGLGCASSFEYPRIYADPAFGSRRSVLIDLPGSGYSEKPDAFDYTTSDQAAVAAELVEHLGLHRFYLYGHSMGGSIAIQLAALMSAKIAGLIVSEPNFKAGGGMFSSGVAAQSEQEFVNKGYYDLLAAEQSPWAGSLLNTSPRAMWREASSLVTGVSPSWDDVFITLQLPKALIFGEHSLPDKDFEVIQAAGIQSIVIPNAGHSMSWENPAGLARALAAFCGNQ
ncbi:alpha/beta hydrolase [Enterobacteriaceae bacterium H11S18]|uniref:alpha/beta fold hydrolase n=1 Tax=Dryocola clanedunensis TaxID=2925396 RepID=UPI0022F042AB|nr:alpha/beta hydrolase [Dryocola clanedunensis]MCT4711762.1 alpha/beta hydrolase [Dryocola clanedunensis]